MTETLSPTIHPGPLAHPTPIEHFDPPGLGITPPEQLERIRGQVPEFKASPPSATSPSNSRIPGVATFVRRNNLEVVMNMNTPEYASWQYNSMVKEKLIADPVPDQAHFPQVFPSSELTSNRFAPRFRPTFEHGDLTVLATATPS